MLKFACFISLLQLQQIQPKVCPERTAWAEWLVSVLPQIPDDKFWDYKYESFLLAMRYSRKKPQAAEEAPPQQHTQQMQMQPMTPMPQFQASQPPMQPPTMYHAPMPQPLPQTPAPLPPASQQHASQYVQYNVPPRSTVAPFTQVIIYYQYYILSHTILCNWKV